MTINFYSVEDDPRTIEKTLVSTYPNVGVNLLGSCSVHDPQLVLSYDSRLLSSNYFEIVEWNSYYFMGDPILSPGGRCTITGHEDVLMTYKDKILALNAYCTRCESKFERYAIDSKVPSLVTTIVTNLQFSGHVFSANGSQRQFLLTVKGGSLS